jgi:hypothetical protein
LQLSNEGYPVVPPGHTRVVIDLDGVLAEDVWPRPGIGAPRPDGVDLAVHYFREGYEVVMWTARPASHLPRIMDWLRHNGLREVVYDVVTDKPVAGLYIDDRAWNPVKPQGDKS